MVVQAVITTVLGIMLLYLGMAGGTKSWTNIAAIIGGMLYMFIGLFIIVDPPITTETIAPVMTIVSAVYFCG